MNFNKIYGDCIGPLDFPMSDEGARDLEKKLDSGEYAPFRFIKNNAFESFNAGERADISVISDASLDKDGEVIDPDSLNFSQFQKNPVVAFNHRYDLPPVGKSMWQKKTATGWKAKTRYLDRPKEHPSEESWLPDTLFHLVKSGSMKGKSIGGAVKMRQPTQDDANRLGFDLNKCKAISDSVEVWEYSVCPIGANHNSVVEAISKSQICIEKSILQSEMPEVYEAVKKYLTSEISEEEMLEAGAFKTLNEFNSDNVVALKNIETELIGRLPGIVDQAYKRIMGIVE